MGNIGQPRRRIEVLPETAPTPTPAPARTAPAAPPAPTEPAQTQDREHCTSLATGDDRFSGTKTSAGSE